MVVSDGTRYVPQPLRRPLIRITPPVVPLRAASSAEQDVTVVPDPEPPPVVPVPYPWSWLTVALLPLQVPPLEEVVGFAAELVVVRVVVAKVVVLLEVVVVRVVVVVVEPPPQLPSMHWLYHSLDAWQHHPETQLVGPVQPLPPHCPHGCACAIACVAKARARDICNSGRMLICLSAVGVVWRVLFERYEDIDVVVDLREDGRADIYIVFLLA